MLSGTLPGGLTHHVEVLVIGWTAVSGTVPAQWGFGRLRDVELPANRLSGTIPPSYGALTDLIDLDLFQNRHISGTLPESLSALTRLRDLSFDTNAISGTLPAAYGQPTSQWEDIRLFGNSLSGTLPSSLADLTRLAFLRLGDNAISGSLPAAYGGLERLRFVTLENNALEGTLPASFGLLQNLVTLDVRNNQLTLPSGARELNLYDRATSQCASGGGNAQCRGLPPLSCTAFGENAVPSLTVPSSCIACAGNEAISLLLLALFLLVVVGCLVFFVGMSVRHAHSSVMRRWVSACMLLINHAQSLATLGSLSLAWPASVRFMLDGFFSTNPLDMPGVSCLLSDSSANESNLKNESTNRNNTVMLALPAALLLALLAYREWLGLCGHAARAARAELALSLVFSLQLIFSWRVVEGWALGTAGYLEQIRRSRAVVGMEFSFMQELGEYIHRDPTTLPPAICATSLLLLQLYLVGRFARLVQCFHRGIKRGQWRLRSLCSWRRDGGRAVHPRHLSHQVCFLTQRFAPHAPRWQLVIWARQLALVALAGSAKATQLLEPTASAAAENPARFGFAAAAIVVLLVAWRAHTATQPFAYRYQNAIESALYATTILFVVLACLCSAIQDERAPAFVALEVVLLLLLVGSFIAAVAYMVLQLRAIRQFLSNSDDLSGAVLANADATMDAPLRQRLADGTIRLLRCRWLASAAADESLRQAWTVFDGETTAVLRLCRRQELPPEAFCTPDEAVALLARGDRSVLALSHRWQTYMHPDPCGSTLAIVRDYLRQCGATALECGLFVDFASLPQAGYDGAPLTTEERATLTSAQQVMGSVYASIAGTAVLLMREVPPRPSVYDGWVTLLESPRLRFGSGVPVDGLRAELARFGTVEHVQIAATRNGNHGSRGSTHAGPIHVRFATHPQAEACVEQLRKEGLTVELTYRDTTAYDEASAEVSVSAEPHSKVYSGWCTFEQGSSMVIGAFLRVAEQQAATRGLQLPLRFAAAQASRPKVIILGAEGRRSLALSSVWRQLPAPAEEEVTAQPKDMPASDAATEKDVSETDSNEPASSDSGMRATEEHAEALLRATEAKMEHATFGHPQDRAVLEQQLHELEWVLKAAADQAAAQHTGSGLTVDPAVLSEVARNPARFQFRARGSSLWPERSISLFKNSSKTQLSSGSVPRANTNANPTVVQV